jgi:hypothetical protein
MAAQIEDSREDEFIANLPDNPVAALHAICKRYSDFDLGVPAGREMDSLVDYLRLFALAAAYIEGKD